MKKTNKKKDNDIKKILMSLAIVILIIIIVGGATFAYWTWETNTAQQTIVTGTIPDKNEFGGVVFKFENGGVTRQGHQMYPTATCGEDWPTLVGEVTTVTAENPSTTNMFAFLAIRATLTPKQGTISSANAGKVNWAVVDTSTSTTCATTPYKGTLSAISKGGTFADIDTTIRFDVPKGSTGASKITKTYKLYIWLDSTYTFKNSGSTISDPMQKLNINVGWSPDSVLAQDASFEFAP